MQFASDTEERRSSPHGNAMDRFEVPTLTDDQELRTMARMLKKSASRACKMSQIAVLRSANGFQVYHIENPKDLGYINYSSDWYL